MRRVTLGVEADVAKRLLHDAGYRARGEALALVAVRRRREEGVGGGEALPLDKVAVGVLLQRFCLCRLCQNPFETKQFLVKRRQKTRSKNLKPSQNGSLLLLS